jgi:hypothetical protein
MRAWIVRDTIILEVSDMKRTDVLLALLLAICAPVYLAACDEEKNNEDTATDTLLDTTPDTSVDTTPDTTPDPTGDTAIDTAVDTGTDTDPSCVSTTAANGGTCSVLTLCGCEAGQLCMIQGVSDACQLYEMCVPGTAGSVAVGAECATPTDCVPGSICVQYMGEDTGHCYQWCATSADCDAAGSECTVGLQMTLSAPPACAGTTATTPLNACSLPCPADVNCDPFGGTGAGAGCADGEACGVRSDCSISWCFPEGTVAEGGDCTVDGCLAGLICLDASSAGGGITCVPFCDTTHTCTTGTCYPLTPAYPANPSLGYCYG